MSDYYGPFYTIEDVQDILNMRPSELIHAIRKGKITPVAYTKKRHMLLFSHRNRRNYGHATCVYQGHITLPGNLLPALLDGDSIQMGENFGALLDPEGVLSYSTTYPFKRPTPRDWLYDWNPINQEKLNLEAARATPLPYESQPLQEHLASLTKMFEQIQTESTNLNTSSYLPDDINKLELNFHSNANFSTEDLKIPASEIKRYKCDCAASLSDALTTDNSNEHKTTTKARTNQLHELIKRILITNPDISAKSVWRVIEKETDRDDPLFDHENLLLKVDSNCIEWKNKYHKEHVLTWSSFITLLSKLKARLKQESNFIPELPGDNASKTQ